MNTALYAANTTSTIYDVATPSAEPNNDPDPSKLDISTPIPQHTGAIGQITGHCFVQRFQILLTHTRSLILFHGPYTTLIDTTVFTRAPLSNSASSTTPNPIQQVSPRTLAISLAAAQDCLNTAQPFGPAENDLRIFTSLWRNTIELIEHILRLGAVDHESFGWGVFGLAAGYIAPSKAVDDMFLAHKSRLHDALLSLPSLNKSSRVTEANHVRMLGTRGEERVYSLANANREVHLCASLLVQRFRGEEWRRVRWWHGIAVAERWAGCVGLLVCEGEGWRGSDLRDAGREWKS